MKSLLNIVSDGNTQFDVSLFQNYIASKYNAPVVGLSVSSDKLNEMLDSIKASYPSIEINRIEINNSNIFYFIEMENSFLIEMDFDLTGESYSCNVYGTSYSITSLVYSTLIKPYEETSVGVYLEQHTFHMDNHGNIQIRNSVKERSDMYEASKLYYPYLDTDTMFKKYALSSEAILLLVGAPGIGKTKLVSLFEMFMFSHPELFNENKDAVSGEVFFKVAYIKNESILSKDTFWETLRKNNYNFVFLDDADNVLQSRDEEIHTQEDMERKKFISQLLSYTDGTETTNTKFIITTNRNVTTIDSAALRRGRTFDILELQSLSREEAQFIWNSENFKHNNFDEVFKGKESILPAELGAEIQLKRKVDKLEENLGEYLLRDGVSLLHEYKKGTRHKIGF